MLMNEIKVELNKWRDIPRSWVGRLNISRCLFFPIWPIYQSYWSMQCQLKFQQVISWKSTNWSLLGKAKDPNLPTQYCTTKLEDWTYPTLGFTIKPIIKTVQYWQKSWQIDQWKRIKNLEIDPYSQLIFDREAKAIQWNKGNSLVVQWLRFHAPNAGDSGLIPGQGTRSHMLQLRVCMP